MRMEALVAHHQLAELVEVHSSGSILIDLLNDAVQVLLGQSGIELSDDFSQLAWNSGIGSLDYLGSGDDYKKSLLSLESQPSMCKCGSN